MTDTLIEASRERRRARGIRKAKVKSEGQGKQEMGDDADMSCPISDKGLFGQWQSGHSEQVTLVVHSQ